MGDCVASIAAALRACMPCPAAPPTRHWILADRVSESRAQPGFTIDVRLQGIPARDSLGRIAHVRGVWINATGVFACAANNAPVTAYQLRSLIQSIFLEDVTGHAFWASIDARTLLDDVFFRHWAMLDFPYLATGTQGGALAPFDATQTADYGLPSFPNGDPAAQAPIGFYHPLVTLGPGMNPLAGLLPLAALQRRSNRGSFRFKLGTQIAGAPSGVGFTGVLNGEDNAGLDVWFDVVYLPALAVDPAWNLDNYTLPDSSGVLLRPEDATEHVQIRYFPEDSPGGVLTGQTACGNLDNLTLRIAGFTEMDGLSFADARARTFLFAASERDSALIRANAKQDLPLIEPVSGEVATLVLVPYRQRGMGEASGELSYKWSTMGGNAFVRYLHRTIGCNEKERVNAIAEAVSCDPCSKTIPTDAKGAPSSNGTTKSTLLVLDPQARG